MRAEIPDSVEPGGVPTPLGARGATSERRSGDASVAGPAWELPRTLLLATLATSLLAYAAIATDVVHDGRLSELDQDVSDHVAGSMPAWAEWIAEGLSRIGGPLCVTLVVAVAVLVLWLRRERVAAALVVVVALGIQLLVATAKNGYDRPRPTAGSPIAVPSSFSFPSGHAATGIAVFGLLGLLAASRLPTRAGRIAAISAGFVLGLLIGASRLVLDVHFLTDVLAGTALGLAWLSACLLGAALLAGRGRLGGR